MKKIFLLGLMIAVIGLGLHAWGISKIGGLLITSPDNGFSVKMPEEFEKAQQLTEDRIRLIGPMVIYKGAFQTQIIEIDAFSKIYPTLIPLSREEIAGHFESLGWRSLPSPLACADIFRVDSPTAISIVSHWGAGKGIVVLAINTPDGRTAIEQIYASLKIDPQACL